MSISVEFNEDTVNITFAKGKKPLSVPTPTFVRALYLHTYVDESVSMLVPLHDNISFAFREGVWDICIDKDIIRITNAQSDGVELDRATPADKEILAGLLDEGTDVIEKLYQRYIEEAQRELE